MRVTDGVFTGFQSLPNLNDLCRMDTKFNSPATKEKFLWKVMKDYNLMTYNLITDPSFTHTHAPARE